jgi:hypothetical protein
MPGVPGDAGMDQHLMIGLSALISVAGSTSSGRFPWLPIAACVIPSIAADYHVSSSAIWSVVTRRTWRHVE